MRKTLLAVALSITALSAHADYQCSVTPRDDVILSPQQVQVKGENGDLVIKPDGNLTFNGKPIDPNAMFLVATNNYRAYGGKFAGTGDSHIAFASPDENRSVLAAWIADESKRAGEIHPAADNNWRLAPIAGDKKLDIRFETSPSDKAAAFIKEKGQYPMNKVATDDIGFAIYQVDLSK